MADITIYKPAGTVVNVKDGKPNVISLQKPAGLTVVVFDNGTQPPTPEPEVPTITGFTATPATINVGQQTTLNATVTNAQQLLLDGVVIPSLPQVVTPTATHAYKLTAIGASAEAQATVTVNPVAPPPNPTISGFTATPSTVNAGQQATLNATVTNAQSLTLDGVVTTLPKVVTPTATHTYELKATGATGTTPATAQTMVTVSGSVPIPVTPDISRYQIGAQGSAFQLVCIDRQYIGGDAYERYQNHTCITTDTIDVLVKSMTNGGPRTFAFARYGIFLSSKPDMTDAVMRSVKNVAADRTTFTITLGTEVDGPYFARVMPVDAANNPLPHGSERYPVYGLWVDRTGAAKNHPKVIGQNGSFTWAHQINVAGTPVYSDVVLLDKAALVATPLPLPARPDCTAFATALPGTQIARVALTPNTDAIDQDRHQPCVTKRGITVTENRQGYTPQLMFADLPINPLLDGPRGVCTDPYSTVLKGGIVGRVYVCSPWSLSRKESSGEKTTLLGLRHRPGLVPYWEEAATALPHPSLEIVGEWDASIPIAERYPLESWFWVWDKRSLLTDPNAPPVDGLPPHLPYTLPSGEVISGPRGFVSDRRGWVLEVRFSGTDHAAPAKARKWITGLLDPWGGDNLPTDNTFAVAQRGAHSIDEWSMDTPNTKVSWILKSAGTGSVQTARGGRTWVGDHNVARTLPICAPESVRVRGNIMTYGSLAQEEVRAYDLATNTHLGVVAKPTFAYGGVGSFWLDHDVSDGTFGPAGTIFTTTFTNSNIGYPEAFLPGGARWNYFSSANYAYGVDRGKGAGNGGHYPTAVGLGDGRLLCANSGGGIDYFCMADAYDPVLNLAVAQRGWEDYRKAGLSIVHGPYCVNRNAYAIVKGANADRDYWYTMLGV